MTLTFKEYADQSYIRNTNYDASHRLAVCALGLSGEAGEVSEKLKKLFRDHNGVATDALKEDIKKELGDVLWYINALASQLDLSLEDIAQTNINKQLARQQRNTLAGSGDNR